MIEVSFCTSTPTHMSSYFKIYMNKHSAQKKATWQKRYLPRPWHSAGNPCGCQVWTATWLPCISLTRKIYSWLTCLNGSKKEHWLIKILLINWQTSLKNLCYSPLAERTLFFFNIKSVRFYVLLWEPLGIVLCCGLLAW